MTLPQTPPARICAIVVTFNRLEKFRRTVERLLAEPLDQVLVIENGSTDGTREWLRGLSEPRLTVLEMAENGGGAQGFETGMREARNRFDPDWYLVMDDDARPMPGCHLPRWRDLRNEPALAKPVLACRDFRADLPDAGRSQGISHHG